MSSTTGLKERIRRLKLRAAALRRHGREEEALEVEDEIRGLEMLPKDGFVAQFAEAVLDLEENLEEYERGGRES